MKDISPNSEKQAFTFTTYLLRGRLFRSNSFDIMDPTGSIVLRAKPPTIISSDKSIFSSNGDELVACQNKCSLKEAYYSGVFKYEFKDILTSQTMGSLKGISNKGTPEYLNWITAVRLIIKQFQLLRLGSGQNVVTRMVKYL
jgi:hypothetical protein